MAKFDKDFQKAIAKVREKIGSKIFGLSTHNKDEIKQANTLKLDYIGLGAYRDTSTKDSVRVGGKKLLELAKLSKHKVALIGGVKLDDNFDNYKYITYKVVGSDLIKKYKESI